jgi:hypothetical protein
MLNEIGRSTVWPGITIWAYPRIAIRRVLDEDTRPSPVFWAALRGFASILLLQTPSAVAQGDWNIWFMAASVFLAPVLNIGLMYLIGIVTARAGHWLGGSATRLEVRTAWAWSSITVILQIGVWVLAVLATATSANVNTTGSSFVIQTFYPLAITIIPLWGLGIFWFGLSEMQQFSLGWGALSLIISLALLMLLGLLLSLFLLPCFTAGTLVAGILAMILTGGG